MHVLEWALAGALAFREDEQRPAVMQQPLRVRERLTAAAPCDGKAVVTKRIPHPLLPLAVNAVGRSNHCSAVVDMRWQDAQGDDGIEVTGVVGDNQQG